MSRIDQMFSERGPTLLVQFFPQKTGSLGRGVFGDRAFSCGLLSFRSPTAGGSTRARTHDLVVRLRSETSLLPMPHLTGRGHTKAEMESILVRFAESGVDNILALRGDPPKAGDPGPGDFPHAIDLVRFIKAFNESGGHPNGGFAIGIAGYPEGHHETPNLLTEMDHFRAKVDAGADFVISQLFFDNRRFLDWRDRCTMAGIQIPLVAGLMPITSAGGMRRMAELAAGTLIPARLLRGVLDREADPDGGSIRVLWATEHHVTCWTMAWLLHYYFEPFSSRPPGLQTLGIRDSRSFMTGSHGLAPVCCVLSHLRCNRPSCSSGSAGGGGFGHAFPTARFLLMAILGAAGLSLWSASGATGSESAWSIAVGGQRGLAGGLVRFSVGIARTWWCRESATSWLLSDGDQHHGSRQFGSPVLDR